MATFDLDEFPIVKIKFSKDYGGAEEYDKYEQRLGSILNRFKNNQLKILFDASECECTSIQQIYRHGKFMINNDKSYRTSVDRTGILVPSDTWISYINLLFTFRPPTRPTLITTDANKSKKFMMDVPKPENAESL